MGARDRTGRSRRPRTGQARAGLRGVLADIVVGEGGGAIERLEAHFARDGYALHRHDTYAIGITLSGVQTFRYRGSQRYSLPGECHILHPDEPHDGAAADEVVKAKTSLLGKFDLKALLPKKDKAKAPAPANG